MKTTQNNFNKKRIILIFLIVLVTISIVFVFYILFKPDSKKSRRINYIYNFVNSIDYKVNLYENTFYEEPYLEMDKQYTSKLVKDIEINFSSVYSNSIVSDFVYSYKVSSSIIAMYQENSNKIESALWSKDFVIDSKDDTVFSKITTSNIEDKIVVDFQYFNDLVTSFKKEFRLDVSSILKVSVLIDYKINSTESGTINMILSFPLLQSTFSIDLDYDENINKIIYYEEPNNNSVLFKIISLIILLGFDIFLILRFIKIISISKYSIRLNRIFRQYGNVIAETLIKPNYRNSNIIPIKNIEDLIDIEQELKLPIIYYCDLKESWFLIEHGKNVYKFVLKNGLKE